MLEIFNQLIYEYQKGMRDMVLYTCSSKFRNEIETLLKKHGLVYKIYALSDEKINVFFGAEPCIKILENFSSENLSKITKEEDFILGIMLGYSRETQYERLLSAA